MDALAVLTLAEAESTTDRVQVWLICLKETAIIVSNIGVSAVSSVLVLNLEGHTWGVVLGACIPRLPSEPVVVGGATTGLSISELHIYPKLYN